MLIGNEQEGHWSLLYLGRLIRASLPAFSLLVTPFKTVQKPFPHIIP